MDFVISVVMSVGNLIGILYSFFIINIFIECVTNNIFSYDLVCFTIITYLPFRIHLFP